jgi:lipid-A-disaccharide synthase-like uncharacterized protein
MGCDGKGAGEHHAGVVLVFQLLRGIMLLAYACYRVDHVFIVGQATGLVIYTRNLSFIWLGKRTPSPVKLA